MIIKKSRSKLINTTSPPDTQHPNPSSVSCNGQQPVPFQDGKKTLRRECEPSFSDCSSRWPALSPSNNISKNFTHCNFLMFCNAKYVQSPQLTSCLLENTIFCYFGYSSCFKAKSILEPTERYNNFCTKFGSSGHSMLESWVFMVYWEGWTASFITEYMGEWNGFHL